MSAQWVEDHRQTACDGENVGGSKACTETRTPATSCYPSRGGSRRWQRERSGICTGGSSSQAEVASIPSDSCSHAEVRARLLGSLGGTVWELIYWPCFAANGSVQAGAGRAEYIRALFEELGEAYVEIEDADLIRDLFWRCRDAMQATCPTLAPPALRRGTFVLAQTPAIVRYVARVFGLLPRGGPEVEARADQICEDIHEYIAEGRNAFHPSPKKPYHQQRAEAAPHIAGFERQRLPRYMEHFERLLAAANEADGCGRFFLGGTLSYVDLQVWVMLRVTASQFPRSYEALHIPRLRAFQEDLSRRPRLAAYLNSPRCRPFAGDSLM